MSEECLFQTRDPLKVSSLSPEHAPPRNHEFIQHASTAYRSSDAPGRVYRVIVSPGGEYRVIVSPGHLARHPPAAGAETGESR